MLTAERPALHAIPDLPHTAALGVTRRVPRQHPRWSPSNTANTLFQQYFWGGRRCGSATTTAPMRSSAAPLMTAARSRWPGTAAPPPGSPAIDDAHFPPGHHDKIPPGDYTVRARTVSEQTFLALGPGAAVWLKEAAAVGTERILQKMAHAVELAALAGRADVDWALGHAAVHGRFATGDLDSILAAKGWI